MKKILFNLAILPGIFFLLLISCKEKNSSVSAEQEIRKMYDEYSTAVNSRNLDKIMSFYSTEPGVILYDAYVPREYKGATEYRKAYESFFVAFPGPVKSTISDLNIRVSGTMAFANCMDHWVATGPDNQPVEANFRATNVLEKFNGKWLIVHEHLSFPADPITGKADFSSKQ